MGNGAITNDPRRVCSFSSWAAPESADGGAAFVLWADSVGVAATEGSGRSEVGGAGAWHFAEIPVPMMRTAIRVNTTVGRDRAHDLIRGETLDMVTLLPEMLIARYRAPKIFSDYDARPSWFIELLHVTAESR